LERKQLGNHRDIFFICQQRIDWVQNFYFHETIIPCFSNIGQFLEIFFWDIPYTLYLYLGHTLYLIPLPRTYPIPSPPWDIPFTFF
jgi:hypothetical protein